jgi:hypothetical protein
MKSTLTLSNPDHPAHLAVAGMIRELGFRVTMVSVAKPDDQVEERGAAGVQEVLNLYAGAGTGFAEHVWERLEAAGQPVS